MEIEREALEARLKELVSMRDQFLANANAASGGIAEIERLLKPPKRREFPQPVREEGAPSGRDDAS